MYYSYNFTQDQDVQVKDMVVDVQVKDMVVDVQVVVVFIVLQTLQLPLNPQDSQLCTVQDCAVSNSFKVLRAVPLIW